MEGRPPPAPPSRVSMFRRLMMVRVTPSERLVTADGKDEKPPPAAAVAGETEVGSVALDKMVLSFMEDSSAVVERPTRGRCSNCFNGNHDGSSSDDEDSDFFLPSSSHPAAPPPAAGDALELLKLCFESQGLVQCASTAERNLLADASRIAIAVGGGRKKKAEVRRAVADGLRALGYDAAVCTSRWEKGPSHPAGEHEYIDVLVVETKTTPEATATRLVVEVDFRSEFEVVRPTKAYRSTLQALPPVFVGTTDRLGRVVALVADAARQSLRKRGLHFPPWRKPEYMRAKWLSPHARACSGEEVTPATSTTVTGASFSGEFELRFDAKPKAPADNEEKKAMVVVSPSLSPSPWRAEELEASKASPLPAAKGKVVTGLASVL
ncbi:hypothetical protein HU200_000397 [Digitaria exilis]|uniref:Uncharacterized protein n=1 Tax=Digitaria exilis TaxID=1010633 RepID=A0A835G091_9POAL|nr:hypothetical protein HU200_016080 [Digitaria exilis]KAF8783673.1 hypothetical protein HU200_000397 [Digitaria exilis]